REPERRQGRGGHSFLISKNSSFSSGKQGSPAFQSLMLRGTQGTLILKNSVAASVEKSFLKAQSAASSGQSKLSPTKVLLNQTAYLEMSRSLGLIITNPLPGTP